MYHGTNIKINVGLDLVLVNRSVAAKTSLAANTIEWPVPGEF